MKCSSLLFRAAFSTARIPTSSWLPPATSNSSFSESEIWKFDSISEAIIISSKTSAVCFSPAVFSFSIIISNSSSVFELLFSITSTGADVAFNSTLFFDFNSGNSLSGLIDLLCDDG